MSDLKTRAFKFRVWNKPTKVMYAVAELSFKLGGGIYFSDPGVGRGWCASAMPSIERPCVLMQFTGQKDCNGTDIYEGDILTVSKEDNTPLVVEFVPSESSYIMFDAKHRPALDLCCDWPNKTVIGNIYQNPELLVAPA